jgi:DNA repair exonuclease SbcCD ATPase subunit
MKILNFSFRNLCSYGNKLQSFTFSEDPQLILVEGKNGGGKSTISDAITFAIYSKSSIRKTTALPNRLNKNGYTYIDFITGAGDTISIERGLQPNFLRLAINGVDHNLPDKRRIDEFIEDELVKIPFNIFSNTISLSINEFKSFVKLSPNDKRQIIDKIFGIEIVNDMSKKNKEDLKSLRLALHTLDVSIDSNTTTLNNSLAQLTNMKEDLSVLKDARKKELEERIAQLQADKELYQKNYNEMTVAATALDKAVAAAREARTAAQLTIADWQKKLQIYESNKCPHCLSDLTDEGHSKIKDEIVCKKTEQEKLLPVLAKKVQEAEMTLTEKNGEKEFARNQFYKVEAILTPLKRELSSLSIDEIETEGSEYINGVIESIKKTLEEARIEKGKISEQIKISQEMEDILSENGMKRLLMSQIVPILNKKILRTAKILDFPFAFEFNMDFDPIITQLGIQVDIDSLSTGEQKKMNLIVLLGIIELIKLKHHSVNLLFLDEIFSSLDVESIYQVVDLLKTFSKKYRMTVFVISHDPLPEELFDRKLSVKKIDHFSDIEFS